MLVSREQLTWHLSASSCSFRSCTSCWVSPSGALVPWLLPSPLASAHEEAGKKGEEELYWEKRLGDRWGPGGGLPVGHDRVPFTAPLKLPWEETKWWLTQESQRKKVLSEYFHTDEAHPLTDSCATCLAAEAALSGGGVLLSSIRMYSCSSWFFLSSCIRACS